jgi:hypothetical protein
MLPILPIFPEKIAKTAILLGFQSVFRVNLVNRVSNVPATDRRRFCFVSMDSANRTRRA